MRIGPPQCIEAVLSNGEEQYSSGTSLCHNLAHLGHKKLTFDCFECSFLNFFSFKYVLTQTQVIKAFYLHKINKINILLSFLMSDNIIST